MLNIVKLLQNRYCRTIIIAQAGGECEENCTGESKIWTGGKRGAEYYTRLLAEKLTAMYEVEVVTTKAHTYDTWENTYSDDEEIINGVKVLR